MFIILGARKATKRRRARAAKSVNYAAHYMKYGRAYYVKNRRKILKKARTRYNANKAKYKKIHQKWLRRTKKGKRPLYLSGKGGRRPKFPRLKPIYQKVRNGLYTIGRKPKRSGRAFGPVRKNYRHEGKKTFAKRKRRNSALKAWRTRRASKRE